MIKNGIPLFFYAETSVHLGSGHSLGAIDLTIQRERFTDLPMGAASGLKGVLREYFESKLGASDPKVISMFGPDTIKASEHAGAVTFSDLRLLLFPIRSLKGVFAWATCPLILERLKRDLNAINLDFSIPNIKVNPKQVTTSQPSSLLLANKIYLDEYEYATFQDEKVNRLAKKLSKILFPNPEQSYWSEELSKKLIVIPDEEFVSFTKYSLEVQARIKLNSKKTTSGEGEDRGNLFYQENIPSESVLYSLVLFQDDLSGLQPREEYTSLKLQEHFNAQISKAKYIQIGGGESIGKGIVRIQTLNKNEQTN